MTIKIANAAQLTTALAAATGGETFLLAPGNYGTVAIQNRDFAAPVRIQSEFADDDASFDRLLVKNSSNLIFSELDLGRALAEGEATFTQLNNVRDSENITFSGVRFHGSLDNDPTDDATGLHVLNTRGIVFEDVLFTDLKRGLVVEQSYNLVVRSSEWKTIRSDGMNIIATEGVVIRDNHMSDFRPVLPDHGDGIQFWNTGQTKGSRDITIENNHLIFNSFSGVVATGVQGIFISDPLEFGYENILIRNNVLYSNGAYHGINVDGGRKVQITDNTVVSARGDTYDFWIRTAGGDGIIVDRNVADNYIFANVTKLFQGENINLKLTPAQAALLPNIADPDSAADLITPGIGYSAPALVEQAPVSDALGSALLGSMTGQQDLQVRAPVAAVEPLRLSEIFATAPVIETLPAAVAPQNGDLGMFADAWSMRNSIYADHFALA